MNPYLRHLEKAGMAPGAARAVEGLLGAAAGVGAGGLAGRFLFTPQEPTHVDRGDGMPVKRPLTPEERKVRNKYMGVGAGVGAGVLVPTALIVSAIRGKKITEAEAKNAKQLVDAYVQNLRREVARAEANIGMAKMRNPEGLRRMFGDLGRNLETHPLPGSANVENVIREGIETARDRASFLRKFTADEIKTLEGLADVAKKERSKIPFRGRKLMPYRAPEGLMRAPSLSRHEGQIIKRLTDEAKPGEFSVIRSNAPKEDARRVRFVFTPDYWRRRVYEAQVKGNG